MDKQPGVSLGHKLAVRGQLLNVCGKGGLGSNNMKAMSCQIRSSPN